MSSRRVMRSLLFVMFAFVPVASLASPPLLTSETKLVGNDRVLRDDFGSAVAVSGDTAVVGAICGNDVGTCSGSAYVFVRTGGVWSQQQELTASDPEASDELGVSVAMSGDTVLVGANGKDGGRGAVYVFVRSGGVWNQQQKLTASDAAVGDWFGRSVSLNGDTALVGAPFDDGARFDSGSAYVFVRSGGVWSQRQKLVASEPALSHQFGWSCALSGDTAVVGTPLDGVRYYTGSAFVFVRSGDAWSLQQKLVASDPTVSSDFGRSVALSDDTVLVGAPYDGEAGHYVGAVYVFVRSDGVWVQQQKLTASDAAANDAFGLSVGLSEDTAAIGCPFRGYPDQYGVAFIFAREDGMWTRQQKLMASDSATRDNFGGSIAVSGDTVVVAVPRYAFRLGAAYVYEPQLTALSPAKIWVGLKNSDDVSVRFDLMARVLLNGTAIGEGQLSSVWGGSSGFNNAVLETIPLTLISPVTADSGDPLAIEFLVRNACASSGKTSGTARLWYNGNALDTGAGRDAGSRINATIGGAAIDYFPRGANALSTTAGSSKLSVDRAVGAKCGAFTSFGIWNTTLP